MISGIVFTENLTKRGTLKKWPMKVRSLVFWSPHVVRRSNLIFPFFWSLPRNPLISGASGPSHSSAECPVFSGLDSPPTFDGPCPEYSAVNPIRILALRERDPSLWSRVDLLMDHVQDMTEEEREMWGVRNHETFDVIFCAFL